MLKAAWAFGLCNKAKMAAQPQNTSNTTALRGNLFFLRRSEAKAPQSGSTLGYIL